MSAERQKARVTVLLEDERSIATEWRFAPGAETGWHKHGHDYIVVPMTTGKLLLDLPGGGTATGDLVLGKPYSRKEGVEHNVINDNPFELTFIEIELKQKR